MGSEQQLNRGGLLNRRKAGKDNKMNGFSTQVGKKEKGIMNRQNEGIRRTESVE